MACSIVQQKSGSTGSGAGVTVTLTSAVTAGNLIVAIVSIFGDTAATPTDNKGNTYTSVGTHAVNSANTITVYTAKATTGGSAFAVTANNVGGVNGATLEVYEVAGWDGTTATNGYAVNNSGGNVTSMTCPSVTSTVDGDLYIGAVSTTDAAVNATYSASAPWTLDCNLGNASSLQPLGTVHDVQTSHAALAPVIGWNISDTWYGLTVVIRAAAGGPTVYNRSLAFSVVYSESLAGQLLAKRSLLPAVAYSQALSGVRSVPRSLLWSIAYSQTFTRVYLALRALAWSIAYSQAFTRVYTAVRSLAWSVAFAITFAHGSLYSRSLAWSTAYSQAFSAIRIVPRALTTSVAFTWTVARVYTAYRSLTVSTPLTWATARVRVVPRTLAPSTAFGWAMSRLYLAARSLNPSVGFSAAFTYAGQATPTVPPGGDYELLTAGGTQGAAVPPMHGGFSLHPDLATWLALMGQQSGRYLQ